MLYLEYFIIGLCISFGLVIGTIASIGWYLIITKFINWVIKELKRYIGE